MCLSSVWDSADLLLYLEEHSDVLPLLVKASGIWPDLPRSSYLYKLCFALQALLPHTHLTVSGKEQAFPPSCSLSLLKTFFSWLFIWPESCPFRSWFKDQSLCENFFHHPIKEASSTTLFAIRGPCWLSSWCLSLPIIM